MFIFYNSEPPEDFRELVEDTDEESQGSRDEVASIEGPSAV